MNPLVSIIVPAHNNEATILRTLNSLVEQTLSNIEIIVVDDASDDSTRALCEEASALDPRISVVSLPETQTALQARRIGVTYASGRYILFCDADDELAPHAAASASNLAEAGHYDVVHFATAIKSNTSNDHSNWERSLDPFGTELFDQDILLSSSFGRPGAKISGTIWNKLYSRELVLRAWAHIDEAERLPRAQDVYQTFLILSKARRYAGLKSTLYFYNFGAGKSGNVPTPSSFEHFLGSADTFRAIERYVSSEKWAADAALDTTEMLNRLREQFIENQLGYWGRLPAPRHEAFRALIRAWQPEHVLSAAARRHPGKAREFVGACQRIDPAPKIANAAVARRVAIFGNFVGHGGVQRVMATQARILSTAGYEVAIVTYSAGPQDYVAPLPSGVAIHHIGPRGNVVEGLPRLIEILQDGDFHILLNHDSYTGMFLWTALATRLLGVRSATFLHSFSLRGLLDFNERFGYLPEIARTYDMTVTLSEADSAWWRASGVPRVRTLPNFGPGPADGIPETPTTGTDTLTAPSTPDVIFDLLWVGRLQDDTKNVTGALEVFSQILQRRPGSTLAIVGGEQKPGDLRRFQATAERLGVAEHVRFVGAVPDATPWYRSSRLFLTTSTVEGFNLTLVEAQSHGLPVVGYALPYLATMANNPGTRVVEWGAAETLAEVAADLLEDDASISALAEASRTFAAQFSLEAYETELQSILTELCEGPVPEPEATAPMTGSVEVPAAVISELYRLYERMHKRTSNTLRTAKRDSANLRTNFSQLKASLTETRSHQQRLERLLAASEKGLESPSAPKPRPKPASPRVNTESTVGGTWPLWSRQSTHDIRPSPSRLPIGISENSPEAVAIAWAADLNLLAAGQEPQLSSRDATRYDLIRMLHRLAGNPEGQFDSPIYTDLSADDPAIYWAVQRHIMSMPTQSAESALPSWKPHTPLRRRMAAMLLYRAAGRPRYQAPRRSPYEDLSPDTKFYKEMCWAAHQGVLPAVREEDGSVTFNENVIMTLTDVAVALFRQMVGPLATGGDA